MCDRRVMLDAQPPVDATRTTLAANGWLTTCPVDFAEALLHAGSLHQLETGAPLHHAGDAEGGIWGIAAGQANGASGIGGPNAALFVVFMAGEWGGTGPMSGYPRQLDVFARVPSTIISVPQWAVTRLLGERPDWWEHFSLLHFLTAQKFGLLAADLQMSDSRARVAGILLNATGSRRQGDDPVRFATTQEEVGKMANLSRYPAASILRALTREGLIMNSYGWITIPQPAALRAIANGD